MNHPSARLLQNMVPKKERDNQENVAFCYHVAPNQGQAQQCIKREAEGVQHGMRPCIL